MSTRKTIAMKLVAPLLGAVVLVSCAGDDSRAGAKDAPAQGAQPAQGAKADAPAQATVSLSGCVEAAVGSEEWVLRGVRFEPRHSGDPNRETTTAGAHGITEGSYVRLVAGNQDMKSHAGQRVTVTGVITDDGRNTIGTAGTGGAVTASGEKSQAASTEHHSDKVKKEAGRIARESLADGTAAEVRVQQVQPTGEKCAAELNIRR
jgi:hypothetical protein